MSSPRLKCSVLQYDGTVNDVYYECGRLAKFKIKNPWKGKYQPRWKYLCGIHQRAHDKSAVKAGRPLATPLKTRRGEG